MSCSSQLPPIKNFPVFSQDLVEWLTTLSLTERVRAVALVYSHLTVCTRELFLPGIAEAKEHVVLNMLHGLNEMHHTLSNYLLRHSKDEESDLEVMSKMLVEIANQYGIANYLRSSVEFARSRNWDRESIRPSNLNTAGQ